MTNQQKILLGAAAAVGTIGVALQRRTKRSELEVAEYVDIARYLGTWYEIARKPVTFEKGCYGTQANYSLRKNGKTINVVNTCRKGSLSGPIQVGRAKAWVADKETNAKLKLQFQWPFRGDYWILDVGPRYNYALVGEPGRKSLWILSRTPTLPHRIIRRLLQKARWQGFDTDDLIYTTQPA